MDGVAYLLSQKYKIGTLNERIPDGENRLEILVSEKSVSRREWMDAGRRLPHTDGILIGILVS